MPENAETPDVVAEPREVEPESEENPEEKLAADTSREAGGEAQPEVEEQPAEAQPESSPSEEDRLAEEQMLAEMAKVETDDQPEEPVSTDIREPEMSFSKSEEESPTAQPVEFPQLKGDTSSPAPRSYDMLLDVKLPVSIELGRTTMTINDILALGGGSVVELDKLAGEPVDLLVNDKIIARGEVVVVDENFGIRITSLISPQDRIKSL